VPSVSNTRNLQRGGVCRERGGDLSGAYSRVLGSTRGEEFWSGNQLETTGFGEGGKLRQGYSLGAP